MQPRMSRVYQNCPGEVIADSLEGIMLKEPIVESYTRGNEDK